MLPEKKIRELIEEKYRQDGLFIVDVSVGKGNEITIRLDKDDGITIDECAQISRFIGSHLEGESEEYTLEVSSPGLTTPFAVPRQYEKHLNKMVDVVTLDGQKQRGKLIAVSREGIELECTVKPGQQEKSGAGKICRFYAFNQIKTTKAVIDF